MESLVSAIPPCDSLQPIHLNDALQIWRDFNHGLDCPSEFKQRAWTDISSKQKLENLLAGSNEMDRARLFGCAAPWAGDWLQTIPSGKIGTRLTNEQLRIAVSLRLGANVFLSHTCVCGAESDARGNHALCCRFQRGRFARHTMCNEVILRALNTADIPSQLEPPGLSRTDGKRPDGVSLIPWSHGRSVVWDFTCAHRLAPSLRHLACDHGASIASHREDLKAKKYQDLTAENGFTFCPVSCETLGGFGPASREFITEIASRIATKTGDIRAHIHLRQRLGIAVQVGNAVSITETLNNNTNCTADRE